MTWQEYLHECSKRYQEAKAKGKTTRKPKLNLPRGKDDDHMPSVMLGLHPIKKEKDDAERLAMTKRLRGDNPD